MSIVFRFVKRAPTESHGQCPFKAHNKEYYKAQRLLMNYLYYGCVLKLLAALQNLIVKIIEQILDNLMMYNADNCIS